MLYKYLCSKVGDLALDGCTLRFTPPTQLNDPFETTSRIYVSSKCAKNADQQLNDLGEIMKLEKYGILSFSRNPLNPVMWSHYSPGPKERTGEGIRIGAVGSSHGGIVIGIDTEIAGLESFEGNVLPAQFGSVIYTKTKPTHTFANSNLWWLENSGIRDFSSSLLESLQRTFLYKSSAWSYEEEVRVVRNIDSRDTDHLFSANSGVQTLPLASIKEVYVGSGQTQDRGVLANKYRKYQIKYPDCKFFVCEISNSSWDLEAKEMERF